MKGRVVNKLLLLTLCSMVLDHSAATAENGNRMYCGPKKVVKPVRQNSGNRIGSVMPFGPRLILAVLVVSIFVSISVIAVNGLVAPPEIEWSKTMGGFYREQAFSIQQTTDGGYIVAGRSDSWDGDVTINYGSIDYWVVKLDSYKNIIWQRSIGGLREDWAYSVQQTTDEGYIVAGYSDSDWSPGAFSGYRGGRDFLVVKLDSGGNLLWYKLLGGSYTDSASSIQQTADGGYIVAGSSTSWDGDVTGHHGPIGTNSDYWVVKLDSAGNLVWQKCLGGSEPDVAGSIQQTTDGGYIVAGSSYSNNGDVTGNHGGDDYWVVKLDSAGNLVWQKCLGGSYNDDANSIQQTTDGGYIVAGSSTSNDGDVTGHQNTPGTSSNYWVVKLDSGGNIMWDKSIAGGVTDWATSINQTADGGYIVAGISDMGAGNVLGNRGAEDIGVVKLDSVGNLVWQKFLGGTSSDFGYSIQQTADGGYVVAGYSGSIDGDVNINYPSRKEEMWVVKLVAEPTPPVAYFTYTPPTLDAPLTVQFTDASTYNPNSYTWHFGDFAECVRYSSCSLRGKFVKIVRCNSPTSNSVKNPSHIYPGAGTYTVKHTASNAVGPSLPVEQTFTITGCPKSCSRFPWCLLFRL